MILNIKAKLELRIIRLMIRLNFILLFSPLFLFSQTQPTISEYKPLDLFVQNHTRKAISKLFSNIQYKNITVNDGLSQGLVLCIIQDFQGYMWFGTKDGLNKYDGYNFTIYKHASSDSASISNNYISTLFEDSKHRLWIGTDNGLNLYIPEVDRFIKIKMSDDSLKASHQRAVRSIAEDKSGAIWVGTENGKLNKLTFFEKNQYRLDKTKRFTLRELYTPLLKFIENQNQVNKVMGFASSDEAVYSTIWDKNNHLWLSARIFRQSYTFYVKADINSGWTKDVFDSTSLFKNSLAQKDPSGNLWLLNQDGLMQYNHEKASFTQYPIPLPYKLKKHSNRCYFTEIPISIKSSLKLKYSARFIWFFGDDGFFIFETSTKVYTYIPFTKEMDQNIPGIISSFYMDESGMVCLGSGGYGLFTFNPNIQRFSYPDYRIKNKLPLINPSIKNHSILWIYKDKIDPDVVWFSSYSTLFKANRKTETFEPFTIKLNGKEKANRIEGGPIFQDEQGNLWVGSVAGLNFINLEDKSVQLFETKDKGVFSIYNDSKGSLWLTQRPNILTRFDLDLKTFEYFQLSNQSTKTITISSESSPCLYQSDDGLIWIGTANGLFGFDPAINKVVNHYVNKSNDPASLSSNNIFSISGDPLKPGKYLWIGTAGGGLNRFDLINRTFTHFSEKDGIPNNTIYGVLPDETGNLWLSTNKGLVKFGIENEKSQSYSPDDGLQGNEFNRFAHHKAADGEMFFGGVSGLNYFYPKNMTASSFIPNVVVSRFLYFDPTQTKKSNGWIRLNLESASHKVELSHRNNTISIEYASLDFNEPSKNKFKYKLDGINEDWIYSGTERIANYSFIPPGEYTFMVKGTNSDGIWNEQPATVQIMIHPPWWQTWWAYLTYGLLLLGLVLAFRRYELNRLYFKNQFQVEEAKLKEREEVDRLKSNFFANISHEFRTPLTLIIGPLNKLLLENKESNELSSFQIMHRNATRLLRLINQLLDFSHIESGKMKLKASNGDIVAFVKGILMSFQSLADQKKIKTSFNSDEKSIKVYFDRDKSEKIFVNILYNAFKFTPNGGRIIVKILKKGNSVQVIIKDSGQGIAIEKVEHIFDRFYQVDETLTRDQEGSGIGLALTKELVELHGGIISAKSEHGKGSEFRIEFLLGKEHLKPEEYSDCEMVIENIDDQVELIDEIVNQQREETIIPNKDLKTVILVVEDNPDMRAYIRETLQSEYHINETFDGEAGVAAAKAIIPDLIISDLMMPKKNGYELCREVKVDQTTSHIPVILLTAKAERKDKLEGLQTGADDYLIKPFDSEELKIRIKNLVDQRQKLRERFSSTIKVEPKDITVTSMDAQFLQKALDIVEDNLTNDQFNVEMLSTEIGLSRRQLYHKIKALTDFTPTDFILNLRLKKAASLLSQKAGSVSEIAYAVGFSNLSYFARAFKKQFGSTPSKFKIVD